MRPQYIWVHSQNLIDLHLCCTFTLFTLGTGQLSTLFIKGHHAVAYLGFHGGGC